MAERQRPEFEQSVLVRPLLPTLMSSIVDQLHMHVRDDGASEIFNAPANYTGGGLREGNRCYAKVQESPENQVPSHLSCPSRNADGGNEQQHRDWRQGLVTHGLPGSRRGRWMLAPPKSCRSESR